MNLECWSPESVCGQSGQGQQPRARYGRRRAAIWIAAACGQSLFRKALSSGAHCCPVRAKYGTERKGPNHPVCVRLRTTTRHRSRKKPAWPTWRCRSEHRRSLLTRRPQPEKGKGSEEYQTAPANQPRKVPDKDGPSAGGASVSLFPPASQRSVDLNQRLKFAKLCLCKRKLG